MWAQAWWVGAAVGVVSAVFSGAMARAQSKGEPVAANTAMRISGPYVHDNLAVYLVHDADRVKGRNYLTLDEAMAQKKVIVHETGSVNRLTIENVSRDDVYVQSGDIVKGGRQDRTIGKDFVLEGKSGEVPVDAFCVEHGRWTGRGGENAAVFAQSTAAVPTLGLKKAVREADQQAVWANVGQAQEKLSANAAKSVRSASSPSSLQLTLEDPTVRETTEAYVKDLEVVAAGKDDVIGYAFAINGKLNSADLYGSHELFAKLWPRLIRGSAVEAFAERQTGKSYALPEVADVRALISRPKDAKADKAKVNARTESARYEAKDAVLYDTYDRAGGATAVIHRSVLTGDPDAAAPAADVQRRPQQPQQQQINPPAPR